jgi:hypothetical protein
MGNTEQIPYDKLRRMHKCMCEANDALQSEVEVLREENSILRTRTETGELDKMKQNAIVQQTINTNNSKMNDVLQENQCLKEELRKLRNGD